MDPRAPQLALPSLTAFLRRHGAEVSQHDLALESVLWMMDDEVLARCRASLTHCGADAVSGPFERARELAGWSLETLRSPRAFYDPKEFLAAREVVSCIVRAHCAARGDRVHASLDPIEYRTRGCDPRRFKDLVASTEDPTADLFAPFYDAVVLPRLDAESPQLVGLSLTNQQQWLPGLSLARMLRRHGYFVVLGGALISKFTEALRPEFFDVFADAVVGFEGETALLELLHQLSAGRDLRRVPNLFHVESGRVVSNPTRIEDVSALPTPDFEGLPLDLYLAPARVLPILLGKGCYFNRCKFCDIPFINHISKKAYRLRHPETVAADIRDLEQRFGASHFVITDEALSPKILLTLSEALGTEASPRRSFTGYARLEDGFTRPVFDQIAEMGVRKLFFGLESASQEMIDHMDKGTRVSSAGRILRDCRDSGIRFHVFSIIGLPEESEAMARQTYQFFLDNKDTLDTFGNSFGIKHFTLELRTAYFDDRDRYGIQLTDDALDADFSLGLDPDQWKNTRGISFERAEELLTREFGPGLVTAFRRLYGDVFAIWPISEEYSVLYCDRYLHAPFPHQASLPSVDDDQLLSFRLNPAVHCETKGLELHLRNQRQQVSLPRPLIDIITRSKPRKLREHLQDLSEGDDAGAWTTLDRLVRAGFLQTTFETPSAP